MRTPVVVSASRILLGLLFALAGLSGLIFSVVGAPPPLPGLAGEFQDVFFHSHWVVFVKSVELLAGVLLLSNRYVPLALTLLGAVIYNILVFQVTMQPSGVAPGLVATALWIVLARHYRSSLAPLFASRQAS